MNILLKAVPGSVTPLIDGDGNFQRWDYPDAKGVAQDMSYNDGLDWDVWLMSVQDGFTPKSGDFVLGGWDFSTGEQLLPQHPDMLEYVALVGNEFNSDLSTYDGTAQFPLHHYYQGQGPRHWGTVNAYPDDNQARRILAERFETDFAGQMYQRVRFILGEPFDKDNAPNALAILIYTDPERQNYYYTPGAFILDDTDPDNTFWFADTTIGQSPTDVPEPVHYAVALGASPLNGGGTIPADWPTVLTHHSFNWETNLSFSAFTQRNIQAFETRMGWLGYTVLDQGDEFIVDHPDFPTGKVFNVSVNQSFEDVPTVKPAWMSESEYYAMELAFEKAAGREIINSPS